MNLENIRDFIEKENISFSNSLNPFFMFKLLYKYNYIYFFIVGIIGLIINLSTVYILTEYFFGLENYYLGYLFGLTLNLIFNFTFHTILTFKTKKNHKKRFILFIIYSLLLTFLQAVTVKIVTPIVGLEYYLVVIASFILIFSTITFLFFKLYLFRNDFKLLKK
jgi:putative flippase GtrA